MQRGGRQGYERVQTYNYCSNRGLSVLYVLSSYILVSLQGIDLTGISLIVSVTSNNALLYHGIKTNPQKISLVAIFHTSVRQ
jgi:hypothetical protein